MRQPNYATAEMLRLPNLRRIRQMRLLSQRALAEKAGISPATVASLEGGKAAQFETIKKLCEALDVTVESLVGEDKS